MKKAILSYVPPHERLHPESFLKNLRHYKTDIPVILYSDKPQDGMLPIPDPTPIKVSKNRIAIQNLVFLSGVEIAQKQDIERFLYLEADCRIGCDFWAEQMMEEVETNRDMFCAGTPAIFNSKAMTHAQEIAAQHYCLRYTQVTGFKVPVFEAKTPRPVGCVFIMGAGSIFNTAVAADLFLGFERDKMQKAMDKPAFDLWVGLRCVHLFGPNAVNKLPFLTRSFSSYGSKINSEQDRIDMLRTGKACLVHQVKSNVDCVW